MKNSIKPPKHLRTETAAWWTQVHTEWRLEQHHSRLLTMACTAWDRAEQAREILERDGIVIGGRQAAVRPHPAVAIERDARIAFSRLVAQLNLDGDPSDIDPNVRAARRSTRPGGWKASNGKTSQQPHST
jgi:P27 family predicted phage terminase small subunit